MAVACARAELFEARTHARPIAVGPVDRDRGSRIGGAPPAVLVPTRCGCCSQPMRYVLTLESDLLPELLHEEQAASLVVCGGPCVGAFVPGAAKIQAHATSPRAVAAAPWQWSPRGRALLAGALRSERGVLVEALLGAKIGGSPGWLQDALDQEVEQPLELVLQLPDDTGALECGGTYLLGGSGALYVFAPRRADDIEMSRAVVLTQL